MPVVFRGGTANHSEKQDKSPVQFGSGSGSDGKAGENAQFTFHVPNRLSRTYGSKLPTRRRDNFEFGGAEGNNGSPPRLQFTFQAPAAAASAVPNSTSSTLSIHHHQAASSIPRRVQFAPPMPSYIMASVSDPVAQLSTLRQQEPKPKKKHPTCTHPNMERVYSLTLRCDNCNSVGPFGWLYRCTQDREELLRHMIDSKLPTTFDQIGEEFVKEVKPRPRGPEERADQFAFFKEVTAEQMQTYSPEQIKKILQQREHVKVVFKEDQAKRQAADDLRRMKETNENSGAAYFNKVWDQLENQKPWLPRLEDECAYLVCQNCRPGHADRAFMSLDAIVDGDIPATAATGFGFHIFGQRPVCDARVVANLPNGFPIHRPSSADTRPTSPDTQSVSAPETQSITSTETENGTCETSSDATAADDSASTKAQDQGQSNTESKRKAGDPARTSRRRFRPFLRKTLGFPLWNLKDGRGSNDKLGFLSRSPASPDLPNLTNQEHSARVSKAEQNAVQEAAEALTHMKIVGTNGSVPEQQTATNMEKREMAKGQFEAKPLEVKDGVAVLEESVQLHVPDIVMRV